MNKNKIDELMKVSNDKMLEVIQELPSPSQTNTEHVIENIFNVLENINKTLVEDLTEKIDDKIDEYIKDSLESEKS
jgi:hypothetical protein